MTNDDKQVESMTKAEMFMAFALVGLLGGRDGFAYDEVALEAFRMGNALSARIAKGEEQ